MEPRAEFFPVPFPSCTPFIMSEACCGGKDGSVENRRWQSHLLCVVPNSFVIDVYISATIRRNVLPWNVSYCYKN